MNKCLLNIVSNEKSTWVENLEEDSFRFEGSFFSLGTKNDRDSIRECILCNKLYYPKAEMDGFLTSDADTNSNKIMTSDTDTEEHLERTCPKTSDTDKHRARAFICQQLTDVTDF